MKDALYLRVKNYIRQEQLILPGEAVAAGVSGGADSVCLLLVLLRLSREEGFFLKAVHVHHGLRASAEGDWIFVQDLCKREGIPCVCVRADAAASAAEWGTGIEEAGRRIRYEAFREAVRAVEEEQKTVCLTAVAHHLEDQAETVLFHLSRGTGLRGAGGMLPRNGKIIRPLLEETRASIEAWLTEQGVSWRTDETNQDPSYTRNYLRAEILPRLRSGVNPAAAEHLCSFAKNCAEAERYLQERTDEAAARCRVPAETVPAALLPEDRKLHCALSMEALRREDPYLRGRILYQCLAGSTGTRRNLETVHVEALRRFSEADGGASLSMPGTTEVIRSGGVLLFLSEKNRDAAGQTPDGELCRLRNPYPVKEEEFHCAMLEFDGNMDAIPRNQYTKWFDYDKIGTFPVFRTRRPGDRMTLQKRTAPGGTIRKKTARMMLDGRIPAQLRDRIVLPSVEQETLWIPGLRMGDAYRISPETRRILQITWEPEEPEDTAGPRREP